MSACPLSDCCICHPPPLTHSALCVLSPFHPLTTAGIKTMLNELSNTVVFERPKEEAFVRKWQLACEGEIAHVVVMPNITLDKLEEFVQDYVNSRARLAIAGAKRIVAMARDAEAEASGAYDGDSC